MLMILREYIHCFLMSIALLSSCRSIRISSCSVMSRNHHFHKSQKWKPLNTQTHVHSTLYTILQYTIYYTTVHYILYYSTLYTILQYTIYYTTVHYILYYSTLYTVLQYTIYYTTIHYILYYSNFHLLIITYHLMGHVY